MPDSPPACIENSRVGGSETILCCSRGQRRHRTRRRHPSIESLANHPFAVFSNAVWFCAPSALFLRVTSPAQVKWSTKSSNIVYLSTLTRSSILLEPKTSSFNTSSCQNIPNSTFPSTEPRINCRQRPNANFWDKLKLKLQDIWEKAGGKSKKIVRAFRSILEVDQAKHDQKTYKGSDMEDMTDEFQQMVDNIIDIGAMDAATSTQDQPGGAYMWKGNR
ncbi:hypothetical protein B0H16DRAFT_1448112 [Mycena metata]|uniref:Uncharacterized protein n=1 Tax=Mycena metata TaxID=1033252 RepID=A0AAD7K6X8_9AGAR|nr:hypothetical protein B0H16DRAFT_1448112 [Mycena metata]